MSLLLTLLEFAAWAVAALAGVALLVRLPALAWVAIFCGFVYLLCR